MDYYKDLAEMYVGDDVSPDFYGWVFPKYDHVAVGESLNSQLASVRLPLGKEARRSSCHGSEVQLQR